MSLLLGDTVPDFEQMSTHGPLRFHDYIEGSWAILFSHPKDFTPVCTTELGRVARLMPEFERRGVKVIAVSVDPVEDHRRWLKDIEETQDVRVDYPILADADQTVAKRYGMIHPNADPAVTVRAVFIVDAQKKLRASIVYPPPTGRNFDEILRVVDALQLTDQYKVATPVDWRDGDDCIILPTVTDPQELAERFPRGYRELRPYLRITPQPNR